MPDMPVNANFSFENKAEHAGLTIVGTGLQAFGHLTREAIGHIRDADTVFYAIKDPLAAADVHAINPNAINLNVLYGTTKHRRITYVQMAQAMVREVRAGRRVTGVFYGHPGFYVAPARLAMEALTREGYPNRMLPGISALDYLFADLKIDPSHRGLQTFEATDFLLRDRPLNTSGHLVLMQVGPVGDLMKPTTDNIKRRGILFERLIEIYGPDHPCVHYIGSPRPGTPSEIRRLPLSAYRDPANLKRLQMSSTLYLPPLKNLPTNPSMAARLGFDTVAHPTAKTVDDVPMAEMAQALATPTPPPTISPAFLQAMAGIAQNPTAAHDFSLNPLSYVLGFGPLLAEEEGWLKSLPTAPAPATAQTEEVDDNAEEVDDNAEEVDDNAEEVDDNAEEVDDNAEEVDDNAEEVDDNAEEVDDNAEEVDDNAEEVDDNAEEVDDNAEEVDDNAEEVDDNAEEVDDNAEEVDDNAEEVDDNAEEVDDNAEEVDDNAEEVDDNAEEVDDVAKV